MKKSQLFHISSDQAHQFCVDDFFKSLETACTNAGGSYSAIIGSNPGSVTVLELANLLAQNGIRFVYNKSRCIDNVYSTPCFSTNGTSPNRS